jgi:Uma2 family endonuclease
MSVGALIPVEEYVRTSYKPEREYKDGVLVEKAMPKESHAWLQIMLAHFFVARRKEEGIAPYTELRIKLREGRYAVPDLCVYESPGPDSQIPETPPLLWIEILSEADSMKDVWEKAKEVIAFGTPHFWVIDPDSLASELRTSTGATVITDETLRLPNSSIVVPLREVLEA